MNKVWLVISGWVVLQTTAAFGLTADFTVQPGTSVEVGEEVLFDATTTTDNDTITKCYYGWDFGDGYTMMAGYPQSSTNEGGIALTHFFMRPGTFTVKLTVTRAADSTQSSFSRDITVTGTAPKILPRPPANPLLNLKFEGNVLDSSGNGRNGAWQGATGAYSAGKAGQGINLNTSYVTVNDAGGSLSGFSGLTVSFWAKKKDASASAVMIDKNGAYRIRIGTENINVVLTTNSGSVQLEKYNYYDIQDTTWHLYVLVYDGAWVRFYIDGNEIIDGAGRCPKQLTGTVAGNTNSMSIGRGVSDGTIFNGFMDEVRIYNQGFAQKQLFSKFELWHADFHGHIDQFVYAQIPGDMTINSGNILKVHLASDQSYSNDIFIKTGLALEERFELATGSLPAGNYVMTAQVLDPQSRVLDEVKEKFAKPLSGIPHVGINQWNAICVDGTPFFPVTPYMLDNGNLPDWHSGKYINTLYTVGYYNETSIATWTDYLNKAAADNWHMMGPGGWANRVTERKFNRNADISVLRNYVNQTKNHPALLTWHWMDEPNLGPEENYVPAPVVRSWTYQSHALDPEHLVSTGLVGDGYMNETGWAKGRIDKYDYTTDAAQFGGKPRHVADMYSWDLYPLEYGSSFDTWARAMDHCNDWNYNLVPGLPAIESQNVNNSAGFQVNGVNHHGPSPGQLRQEIWLAVVHGAKGIVWFQYFDRTPAENYGVMAEFVDHIKKLEQVVLGPAPALTVTDDANVPGKRVDAMVRQDSNATYIFAVRLTEDAHICSTIAEPPVIGATFTVPGLTNADTVCVPGELSQSVLELKGDPVRARRTFSFTVGQAPIKRGTMLVAGKVTVRDEDKWFYLFDNDSGGFHGNATYLGESGMTGSINYATGQVMVDFGKSMYDDSILVHPGTDSLVVVYCPDKPDRIIPHTGAAFTDSFARDAVHIYKINRGLVGVADKQKTSARPVPSFLVMYPNPAVSSIAIASPFPAAGLTVYDPAGNPVPGFKVRNDRIVPDRTVTSGIYLVRANNGSVIQKIIIIK